MRYIRKPVSVGWVEDDVSSSDAPLIPSLSVDDHECVDTGLLWCDGSPVLRAPNPIGFGWDGEW